MTFLQVCLTRCASGPQPDWCITQSHTCVPVCLMWVSQGAAHPGGSSGLPAHLRPACRDTRDGIVDSKVLPSLVVDAGRHSAR